MTVATGRELLPEEVARRLDRLRIVLRRPRGGAMHGERRGPRQGPGIEMSDFRPYAEGDDPRQIDWRAYARMERLFVKLFVLEEDTTLHLVVDRSQSMAWGSPPKILRAQELAAALGYMALGRQESVRVLALSDEGEPPLRLIRGRAGLPRLLGALAAMAPRGGAAPRRALGAYAAAAGRPGPLVLLSDLYGEGWRAGIDALLAARFEPIVLHVLDPEELRPTLSGDLLLRDDESGEHVPVSIDESVLRAYGQALTSWREAWRSFCSGRGIPYVQLDEAADVAELVLGVLRRRGVVA